MNVETWELGFEAYKEGNDPFIFVSYSHKDY